MAKEDLVTISGKRYDPVNTAVYERHTWRGQLCYGRWVLRVWNRDNTLAKQCYAYVNKATTQTAKEEGNYQLVDYSAN